MYKFLLLLSVSTVGLCMPGGYSEVQDSDQLLKYKDLLTEVLTDDQLSLQQNYIQMVTKIERQVVAGENIRYTLQMKDGQTCVVVIFNQVWTKTRIVHDPVCTKKRQLAGGFMEQTDPKEIEKYSLILSNVQGSSMLDLDQYEVKAIQTQVVAGLNIKYTLSINGAICHIMIFDQPWTSTTQVTHNDCPKKARRQMLVGGFSPVSVNDPNIQKCLAMSVDSVNAMSNNMFRVVASHSMRAMQQLVNGWNYEVTFQTQESTCMNNDASKGMMLADCPLSANDGAKTTYKGHCYMSFDKTMSVTGIDMGEDDKVLKPDLQLDNDLQLSLKPINTAKTRLNSKKVNLQSQTKDQIKYGASRLMSSQRPVVNLLRKKRNVNALMNKLNKQLGNTKDINSIIEEGKALLGGGDDHDVVNHLKDLFGKDGHDMIKHGQALLGGDDHDYVDHVKSLIGGDDHDYVDHGKKLIGGDDHDYVNHGKKLIGGDDHDYVDHGKKLIGGDDHDYVNHGKGIIGGDDHDYVNHGKGIIGGDDHDYVPHGKQNKTKFQGRDGHDYKGMFMEFKAKFNKMYGSEKEEEKRYYTFCENMRTARKIQETEKGTAVYGATKFADLTKEEFQQHVGKKWDLSANLGMKKAAIQRGGAPDSFDWRDHGAVTPVKNQGSCGSCWAFSTTGNIEGQWAIKKKNLVSLSEQELVDCDKVDEGCNGGLPSQAYKEIERLGGLESETDYSYKGEDEKCEFNKTDVRVYINDSVSISSDETEMASWLAANGPISIGINAFAMQFYMGGISHPWKIFCNAKDLDHGVLIVGYGVQDGEPYWTVKNSWGKDWGEKGYYLVYRGAGVCGLNTMCTSAVVD